MARKKCCVEKATLTNDQGREVAGLRVTCECGHSVEVFGQSERSEGAAFIKLRSECPEGGENFYVNEDG